MMSGTSSMTTTSSMTSTTSLGRLLRGRSAFNSNPSCIRVGVLLPRRWLSCVVGPVKWRQALRLEKLRPQTRHSAAETMFDWVTRVRSCSKKKRLRPHPFECLCPQNKPHHVPKHCADEGSTNTAILDVSGVSIATTLVLSNKNDGGHDIPKNRRKPVANLSQTCRKPVANLSLTCRKPVADLSRARGGQPLNPVA